MYDTLSFLQNEQNQNKVPAKLEQNDEKSDFLYINADSQKLKVD